MAGAIELVPDLTFVLDAPVSTSIQRVAARTSGDSVREDWDVVDVENRLRDTYLAITEAPSAFPEIGPVVRLDASRPQDGVLADAWSALLERGLTPTLEGTTR
ncbi:hypothetical protein ACW14Y_41135 [Kitasatospora sp. cg17-2]